MKHDPREIRFGHIRSSLVEHFYKGVVHIAERAGVSVGRISGDIYRESGGLQNESLRDQKIGVWGAFQSENFRELGFEMSVTHAQRWIPVMIVWLEGWKRARTLVVNRDTRVTIRHIEGELLNLGLRCAKLPRRYEVVCSTGKYLLEEGDPRLQTLLHSHEFLKACIGDKTFKSDSLAPTNLLQFKSSLHGQFPIRVPFRP